MKHSLDLTAEEVPQHRTSTSAPSGPARHLLRKRNQLKAAAGAEAAGNAQAAPTVVKGKVNIVCEQERVCICSPRGDISAECEALAGFCSAHQLTNWEPV